MEISNLGFISMSKSSYTKYDCFIYKQYIEKIYKLSHFKEDIIVADSI